MLFWPIFGNFWCPVVNLVTFSSNISNFESQKTKKNTKKIQKNLKISKNPKIGKSIKNPKKIQKKISSKMVKKPENPEKSRRISKINFFEEKKKFKRRRKNAILLVFQY